ncbi:FHF complex subunit HOOK-interacting protein 1B isoform X2 [Corythoichthys intestinalis]|uniref:FHF complex subunit HOOK-interacting protein 1B isoform X2 n=1 Tax=Corythoichthys intestinalis TaxID=161448 RepID=UPI0025A57AD6|nr:FHF complex subunit HOOK-interacting protein 1B isoform X2 [Corythoichthys intestinalis]
MSWLSRLTPRTPAARPGRGSAAPQESPSCTADPETCLMVFENHWRQVRHVLERNEPSRSTDDLIAVSNHADQMFCLLAEERPPASQGEEDAGDGPILQLVVREQVLEHLLLWHLRRGPDPDSLGGLLKLFEMLIGQSRQALLRRPAVLHPLLRLVGACAHPERGCPPALENSLVLLLNQVCVRTARQPLLLETLFRAAPAQQGSTNLLIFSLLVPFIHREGAVGQQARDALLLVMAASAGNRGVARYIAHNSYFCPVLATGLSALYSSLPRKMEVRGDDWHALRREDWMGESSLVVFMNSLEFCNAVVQVAHPVVRSQLLDYLHNGFLVPVVAPALYKSSVDEMIASTAYLDLFLRSVSETALLKTFLRFILLHRLDNDSILDTLLTRISSNSRLCMVSLSLFRTLLSFNCEDIMLQLVLRYLLPCSHVMLSQRRAIREADTYGKCARKFLSLIPECCRASAPPRDEETAFRSKATHNASADSTQSRPGTPSRLAFFIRQQSAGVGAPSSPAGSESGESLSPDSPARQPQPEILAWDSGYLDYLRDARRGIELCSWACRDWSAPYDGEDPSPGAAPPPPPARPERSGGPQRAAAARTEWSGSEHDSGEWDVTIGQNNCISLTPRSKKRGLQREELFPKSVPPQLCSDPLPTSSPTDPASPPALRNGTAGPGQDRELEAKKAKRERDHREFLDENSNRNGSPKDADGATPAPVDGTVESLIRELLEQSPGDARDDGAEERGTPPSDEDAEEKMSAEAKGKGSEMAVYSPAKPLVQGSCQPYTGPLLAVLLAKLENMPHNSLYVNILLTGTVARLACYPQPLLRSFLLNTNMVFQPSVKSLIQKSSLPRGQ